MKSVSSQRKQLYRLFGWSKETEAMHVSLVTGDPNKSTAKELSMLQAKALIQNLTTNWAVFDKDNQKHKYILSLLIQMGWTKPLALGSREIPDMARLSNFLKSNKSPVPKPLQKMSREETSKLIVALENMVKSKYAK